LLLGNSVSYLPWLRHLNMPGRVTVNDFVEVKVVSLKRLFF
jgi:hypothetical protein